MLLGFWDESERLLRRGAFGGGGGGGGGMEGNKEERNLERESQVAIVTDWWSVCGWEFYWL